MLKVGDLKMNVVDLSVVLIKELTRVVLNARHKRIIIYLDNMQKMYRFTALYKAR